MTLREILNENSKEDFQCGNYNINYWAMREKEKSVASGKTILGFPSDRVSYPVYSSGRCFNIVNVGDNTYEFYVDNDGKTNNTPYKHKDCYVGTYKFDKFSDDVGVALGVIEHFLNSKRIAPEMRALLIKYYNDKAKHPYYKKVFKPIKES